MSLRAVMVVDMAGFTAAFDQGVDHALALVAELRRDGQVIAAMYGGQLFKTSGDNLFLLFPDPGKAVDAARELRRRNKTACTAIGWGELRFEDGDMFGLELNRACRLGEDLARAGDILLTEAAAAWLGRPCTCTTLFKGRTFRWAQA